ncbi:uncharacterized protein BP5553_08680 [Venustampulla echinocandica]|uniref:F-box domain-containing protein n=1 Tax=Venustampulla echinocandica TaxID=2656787 RepID=A0A370TEY3_9HELO|nr:uncharacterized protein BP5553_08680 [Venustampulla echinocandica]RDL33241.1 hypothetical protein BP5553_08680 [Venustampulla echinocandica]
MTTAQYQDSDQRQPICFTDLPPPVRRSIYILAGLVRFCPISLNTEGVNKAEFLAECMAYCLDIPVRDSNSQANSRCFYRQKRSWNKCVVASPEGFDCMCMPLPIALLRVSKAVHNEVSSILYAENMFRICRSDQGGLSSLFALSSAALQSLRSLSIKLNACSCVPNHQCSDDDYLINSFLKGCQECHMTCKIGRDFPASVENAAGRELISERNQLLPRLAMYLSPASLRLSIVCDTLDYATAKPFTDVSIQLPQLAECSIRLGQAPNPAVHCLAEEAVYRLTSNPTDHLKPFNFGALPVEIQRRILTHTDLVSPFKVAWYHGGGLSTSECCRQCTDALEACFCSVRHAAFSSMPCQCWVFPSALFLVSRKLHEYATEIFFSKNTFVAYPGDASPDPPDSLHLLCFFQQLPPTALQYLSNLRIELSGLDYHLVDSGTEFQKNWTMAIDFISQNLVLHRLGLRVVDETSRGATEAWYTTGVDDSAELEAQEWQLYQHLAEPLVKLKSIKDLWIHFSRPVHGKYYGDKSLELRQQREIILEKSIIGDAYDNAARGKFIGRDRLQAKDDEIRRTIVVGSDRTKVWLPDNRPPFNEYQF